jgi:hypothetical protein
MKDKGFARFGYVLRGVTNEDIRILDEHEIRYSLRGHGNAYFDYLDERDKAARILNKS